MNPEQIGNNLLAASPEAVAKFKSRIEAESIDRRAITSPINGQQGGRPHLRPELVTENFLKERVTEAGKMTLRRDRGTWYEWWGGYWRDRTSEDVRAAVLKYLQKTGIGEYSRLSKYTVDNVLEHLIGFCYLDSLLCRMPCFLPRGESAVGWMPMKNCVLDVERAAVALERGEPIPREAMRPTSPELFTTYGLDYDFDPAARCPKFLKYLSENQPSKENRESLQMLAGLALVPDCRYNVAFFLYGEAGTGKSVFAAVLKHLVGVKNCCCVPMANLADRFGKAPLTEKLLNVVEDMSVIQEGGGVAGVEGYFKQITAGEEIPVERKGVDAYKAPVTARMVFATNTLPYIGDRSKAMWDRSRIIPFNQRIRGTARQNPNLPDEIVAEELPGVLNWALVGLAKLRKLTQFPECPEGLALKEAHRMDCDHEREFLTEHVEAAPGCWVSSDQLFKKYQAWMLENNYRPTGAANFKKAVKRVFPRSLVDRSREGIRRVTIYRNIRTISEL